MGISYFAEHVKFPEKGEILSVKHIRKLIDSEGFKSGEISVIFVDDAYLLELNKRYLNRDYLTDVITFDYSGDSKLSGDIFISIERVLENASIVNVPFKTELRRMILHGILHLCGYKDDSEENLKEIRLKEDYYLDYLAH